MRHILLTPSTSHLCESFKNQGVTPSLIQVRRFLDGEFLIQLPPQKELPSGEKIITLVHATCPPIHDHIIMLILTLRQLYESGYRVRLVLTYMGYARQSFSIIREIIRAMNSPCLLDVILLDLHQSQIVDDFPSPAREISCASLFADYLKSQKQDAYPQTIVATDRGGTQRAHVLADLLQVPMVALSKTRDEAGIVHYNTITETQTVHLRGKNILIVDDMIDSGQTLMKATQLVKDQGALWVDVVATHGVFSGNAIEDLRQSSIRHITVTNSICHMVISPQIKVIDITPLLLEAVPC